MNSTYALVKDNHCDLQGIHCFVCRTTSWVPSHVAHKYCPSCRMYHDDMMILGADGMRDQARRSRYLAAAMRLCNNRKAYHTHIFDAEDLGCMLLEWDGQYWNHLWLKSEKISEEELC